jgi:hypothetical protein
MIFACVSLKKMTGGDFNTIMRNIIKEQNKELLKRIAIKYNKNYDDLERKYLTASFYSIDMNSKKIYGMEFIN